MKQIITIINSLQYSFYALIKFIGANVWKLIIYTFSVYLLPTYEMIALTFFLLLADMVTGIWKSLKTDVPVTAAKMNLTVEKMLAYMIGILCAYGVQHHITNDLVKVMLIFTSVISFKELKSVIENVEVITDTKIWSYISDQITAIIPGKKNTDKKNETN
jgi:hypothetical protein